MLKLNIGFNRKVGEANYGFPLTTQVLGALASDRPAVYSLEGSLAPVG